MMNADKNYVAKDNGETIYKHTQNVLDNYNLLKNAYGDKYRYMDERMWELLKICVQYHDTGKANSVFQSKCKKEKLPDLPDVPHNYLSVGLIPFEELGLDNDEIRLITHAVGYHHERNKKPNLTLIQEIFQKDLIPQLDAIEKHMNIPINRNISFEFEKSLRKRYGDDDKDFYRYILLKGLLHRLDHVASADGDIKIEVNVDKHIGPVVSHFLKQRGHNKNELQVFTESHSDKHVIVIAQTGLGKTESALLWINEDKAFFTLPLRVSLNAIYNRIKNDMGYDAVGLLHSSSMNYLMEDDEENWESIGEQSRHLSSKLLLTTIDQILKFPFRYKLFEKELAAMANSKVVIDEIQAYDPEVAAMLIKALEMIHQVGGKFMIMTATMPTIYLETLLQRGVISETDYVYDEFVYDTNLRHRCEIKDEGILNAKEDILEKASSSKVLVIVNTVRRAKEIYEQLLYNDNNIPVYLLHSQFIQEDRQLLEKKIKEFSNSTEKGIWITTQLVEASLDIDFDYLFTEISTLDSFFQRLGRCYRKRELTGPHSNVFVYTKDVSGVPNIYDEYLVTEGLKLLQSYNGKLLLESAKVKMIRELYTRKRLKGTDFLRNFDDALFLFDYPDSYILSSTDAQNKLRRIQNYQVIPLSVFEREVKNLLEKYNTSLKEEKLKIRKKIENKTASINHHMVIEHKLVPLPKPFDYIYVVDAPYDFNRDIMKGKGILL